MKTPGTIYKRGTVYWFKVKVPKALASLPKYLKADGSPLIYAAPPISLNTQDPTEAHAKAAPLSAHWAGQFVTDHKALITKSPAQLSEAMVATIAIGFTLRCLLKTPLCVPTQWPLLSSLGVGGSVRSA